MYSDGPLFQQLRLQGPSPSARGAGTLLVAWPIGQSIPAQSTLGLGAISAQPWDAQIHQSRQSLWEVTVGPREAQLLWVMALPDVVPEGRTSLHLRHRGRGCSG